MPRTNIPASCEHLDLALVSRTLAKHYGDVYAAAKELGVSGPDLNRLTWSKPKLLEAAQEERDVVIAIAVGRLISALDSDDLDRRRWAADKILSSYLARGHPLGRAGRRPVREAQMQVTFTWASREP